MKKTVNKGFTLIEVILAIFILGLGMVTSFNLFPVGLQSLTYARRLNEIYFLAERKIEELKSMPRVEAGQTSGVERDLSWTVYSEPIEVSEGITLTFVELDVDFIFRGRTERQRFVTYLAAGS